MLLKSVLVGQRTFILLNEKENKKKTPFVNIDCVTQSKVAMKIN